MLPGLSPQCKELEGGIGHEPGPPFDVASRVEDCSLGDETAETAAKLADELHGGVVGCGVPSELAQCVRSRLRRRTAHPVPVAGGARWRRRCRISRRREEVHP